MHGPVIELMSFVIRAIAADAAGQPLAQFALEEIEKLETAHRDNIESIGDQIRAVATR